jgi:hypothetical protein
MENPMSEEDEVQVSYFVICDLVITEEHTRKQSLIGIYSALTTSQLPLHANMAVAFSLRLQSATPRRLRVRLLDPDGGTVLETPDLPFEWQTVLHSLERSAFATIQIGLNLRMVPITKAGVHVAGLLCDDRLIASYPLQVFLQQPIGS